jgi:hypothetical protein
MTQDKADDRSAWTIILKEALAEMQGPCANEEDINKI